MTMPSQGAEHRLLEKAPTRLHRTTIPRPESQMHTNCPARTALRQDLGRNGFLHHRNCFTTSGFSELLRDGLAVLFQGRYGAQRHMYGILGTLRMTVCNLPVLRTVRDFLLSVLVLGKRAGTGTCASAASPTRPRLCIIFAKLSSYFVWYSLLKEKSVVTTCVGAPLTIPQQNATNEEPCPLRRRWRRDALTLVVG